MSGATARWIAASALTLASCADLVDPTLGVCGNRVVEAGEACDNPDDPRCAPASSAKACRLLCDLEEGADACDPGQLCGSDGVCRAPAATFAEPASIDEDGYQRILVGDRDGDGRDDVVVQFADGEPDGSDVKDVFLSVSSSTLLAEEVVLREPVAGDLAVGDLDDDGLDDVVLVREAPPIAADASGSELSVFVGDPGRARRPSYFATIATVGASARILTPTPEPDRVLELIDAETARLWSARSATAQPIPPLALDIARLGASVPVGDVIDNGPCPGGVIVESFARPELFFAVEGAAEVVIASTCGDALGLEIVGAVALPGLETLGPAGAFVVDGDGDPWPDLLVQDGAGALRIAHGVADGSFHSTLPAPAVAGDGAFSPTPLVAADVELGRLLAALDFDADGSIEVVSDARYLAAPESCAATCFGLEWPLDLQVARPVDLNGDGMVDLAGISDDNLVVALAGGIGPQDFEVHVLELRGPGRGLAVGDFDRDTVADLAYIEEQNDHPNPADTLLTVLYGGPMQAWRSDSLGPFIDVRGLEVEAGTTLVARTADLAGRPAGAFVRPGVDPHRFGLVLRGPSIVRVDGGAAVAMIAAHPPELEERLALLDFVAGSLAPQDIREGDAVIAQAGQGFFTITRAIDVDGDAIDEVLLLGPGAVDNVRLARLAEATRTWELERTWSVGPGFARPPAEGAFSATPGPSGGPGSAVAIADVDDDDDLDVLATTDEATPRVVLLRNDGGDLVASFLSVTIETEDDDDAEALADPFVVTALAAWHTDIDGDARFLVGGPVGAGLATLAAGSSRLQVQPITEDPVVALAAADVDGDGLLDLVLANDEEVSVALAEETVGPTREP